MRPEIGATLARMLPWIAIRSASYDFLRTETWRSLVLAGYVLKSKLPAEMQMQLRYMLLAKIQILL